MKSVINDTIIWLQTNWIVVALVASEVAALLPTKFNGIIQGAVKLLTLFFQKKK